MYIFKNSQDIKTFKEAGRRLSFVLDEVIKRVAPGVILKELDVLAEEFIRRGGDTPAFLNYQPRGARMPYPATLCVSVNNNVVHSIPGDEPLCEGDIVGIDIGLFHKGFATDMARTVPVGKIDSDAQKLLSVTESALQKGIAQAKISGRVGHVSNTIQKYVEKNGFSIVRELGGHGIGKEVHDEPFIPNHGSRKSGVEFTEGMAIAIEPIVNEGSPEITLAPDGYTYQTKDGKRSAHFEHTVLITKDGPLIVTKQ